MIQVHTLPHSCETEEIARLLNALTHQQRRVLRSYVWSVILGERTVSEWLAAEGCPVSIRSWYRRGDKASYTHGAAFQAALAAYVRTAQRWQLDQEQRQIERARGAIVRAAPRAAERVVEQIDGDIGQLFRIAERWTEAPLPTQTIMDERVEKDQDGHDVRRYLVRQVTLDLDKLRDPRFSRLVRKFQDSPKSGLSIEMYDAQRAAESILDRADLETASKAADNQVTLRVVYEDERAGDPAAEAAPETG